MQLWGQANLSSVGQATKLESQRRVGIAVLSPKMV